MRISRDIETSRRGGFTLIELLVSVAILALLVVLLSGVFGGVSKTWQLGQSSNERLQNIRAITDFVSGELRSALLPANRTDKGNLQFVLNPSGINASFRSPDAIFWQAPVATDQALGDVAEVGYFIKWDETTKPGNPRPNLCRFYVANSTASSNFLIYSQNGGSTPWLTDTVINAVAPADKANAYQGLIAENVVAFFVECLDAKGQPITKTYSGSDFPNKGFDSRLGYTNSLGVKTEDFTDVGGGKSPVCVLPPMVKLSFVLIDARFAARIGPNEKNLLMGLASTVAAQTPKGDASTFVTAALNEPQLKSISQGLRAYQAEINLLNAR